MKPLPIDRVYLSHTISEPAFGDTADSISYVKLADGRRSVVRQSVATGLAQAITTEPAPKGGVGYGGGIFAVRGNLLVYAAKDGRLHAVDLKSGEQWPVTPAYEGVAAPSFSPCGRYVAFLSEQDGKCNVLLTESRGKSLPVKLSDDPWYAFNPVFSGDGVRIAWQEWDEMDMPWDQARLQIAEFALPCGAGSVCANDVPPAPSVNASAIAACPRIPLRQFGFIIVDSWACMLLTTKRLTGRCGRSGRPFSSSGTGGTRTPGTRPCHGTRRTSAREGWRPC